MGAIPKTRNEAGEPIMDRVGHRILDRRQMLRTGVLTAVGLVWRPGNLDGIPLEAVEPAGRFLEVVPFDDEGTAPVNTKIGAELDGRLYTDLSHISANRQVTPTSEFYIRTAASRLLPGASQWGIRIEGLKGPTTLDILALRGTARSMGIHLMECAGNVRLTRFGLISVAGWTGIPFSEVLDRAKTKAESGWIEISGFDDYAGQSATSIPGASWIFPMDALTAANAFLATGMNGQLLTADHGAPVRLVVPGWYGCSCIKWVNRIAVVEEGSAPTSQMQEYASRTLQKGIPTMARDFEPATIDHAAVPVRIEKQLISGKLSYRVIGILWGGSDPVRTLQIRFNPGEEFVNVERFRQAKTDPWTVWTHTWSPRTPGQYTIRLSIGDDPAIRSRKLDLGLYDRSVNVSEI